MNFKKKVPGCYPVASCRNMFTILLPALGRGADSREFKALDSKGKV